MSQPAKSNWAAVLIQPHFLVAALILATSAVGWSWTVKKLKWALHKDSIPWPASVRVKENFSLQGFPEVLGPYRMVQGDGVLDRDQRGNPKTDGIPDGEMVLEPDVMEALGMGTGSDKERYPKRSSNWYSMRIYEDPRPEALYRYWRLELTYYTGSLDKVPHVPERCLAASGARLLGEQSVPFAIPHLPDGWSAPKVRRVRFEMSDRLGVQTAGFAQYYVFSINGVPEDSWELVRAKLMDPTLRRCYFAKVQFAPWGDVKDVALTDKAAQEFLAAAMSEVLKVLPTAAQATGAAANP